MVLELHPWRCELEFLQVSYPVVTSNFAATPQSDIVCICAHDFQRHGDTFGMMTLLVQQKMPVFVHL